MKSVLRGAYEKVCRTILQGCVRLRRDIRQLESDVIVIISLVLDSLDRLASNPDIRIM